jgi:hypothetical protein
MEGNNDLTVRTRVNDAYERIVTAIFASLTHLAKMDKGEGQAAEDKGQLNYHVIMIGKPGYLLTSRCILTRQKTCTISLKTCVESMCPL